MAMLSREQMIESLVKVPNEFEAKMKFARAMLVHQGNQYRAGSDVFGDPLTNDQLAWCSIWENDPEVKAEMVRLKIDLGEDSFLPTKADLCRMILTKAQSPVVTAADYAKLMALYADMMDFIPSKAKVDVKTTGTINIMASKDDENL